MKIKIYVLIVFLLVLGSSVFGVHSARAVAPSGSNWFQLLANPFTGADNTGDGGSGAAADYNYFYVGQTFTSNIQAQSTGTNAANIWVDFDPSLVAASNLVTGSYFPFWSGQTLATSRVLSTGYRTAGTSSGLGNFGSVQWTMQKPTASNYGTGTPGLLDINIGTLGATTESNIALNGNDILEDGKDFHFHVWADTKKPYAKSPSPADGATAVPVENTYTFDIRDSKNGEGDDSGVGTGVNVAEPPGTITLNDGSSARDYTGYDAFACSGVWGSNLCHVTITPPSPLGIPGDTRKWNYATTYTSTVAGFRDLASSHQNQLGDPNGPNTMDTKTWTFTTEADTVPPRVSAETPARGSSGNSVSTAVTFDIVDKKTPSGTVSGTGVNASTCRATIASATFPLTTYQQGSVGVTVTPIAYGYRFSIVPAAHFGQNETVSVSAYGCADLAAAPNVMVTDIWTFSTSDTEAPTVTDMNPANDGTIALNGTIAFHIKDNGSVNLNRVIVFVNGVYYTNAGGSGAVTTSGTRITFGSSLNFNGNNYPGDTTSRTGSATDYAFRIDPQADFTAGESIPVLVYASDSNGNLMERVVYGLVAETAVAESCSSGSSYCGKDTKWDSGAGECVGIAATQTITNTQIQYIDHPAPQCQPTIVEVAKKQPVEKQIVTVAGPVRIVQVASTAVSSAVETINQAVDQSPAVTYAAASAGAVATGASLLGGGWQLLWEMLERLAALIGALFGMRRRKEQWGTVYDQKTGAPVPMALVRLYDVAKGKVLETRMTDTLGSYYFLVGPGTYRLEVEKEGYAAALPTQEASTGVEYANTYNASVLIVVKEDGVIHQDIPLTATGKAAGSRWTSAGSFLKQSLFWSGFGFVLFLAVTHRAFWDYVILAVYVLILMVRILMNGKITLGRVFGPAKEALPFVWMTVHRQETGVREARTITDESGRYFLVLNAGEYQLEAKSVDGKLTLRKDIRFPRRTALNSTLRLLPAIPKETPDTAKREKTETVTPPPAQDETDSKEQV